MTAPGTDLAVLPKVLQAAVGLSALYFSTGELADGRRLTTVDSVCLVLDGHIETWDGWSRLAKQEAARFGRLLHRRPNQLANAAVASALLGRMLRNEKEPIPGCTAAEDIAGPGAIAVRTGMSLTAYVDEALDLLDRLEARRNRVLPTAVEGHYITSTPVPDRRSSGAAFATFHYEIRAHHLAIEPPPPKIVDAAELAACPVHLSDLRRIAARLDALPGAAGDHHVKAVQRFEEEVRAKGGPVVTLDLVAGTLNGLLAYPGFGKSVVLVRVLGCWAVEKGIRIAFVLPTNADVVQTAATLERVVGLFRGAGEPPVVVPLMSPNSLFKVADTTASSPARSRIDPDWSWRKLGYACALPAVATTDSAVDRWQQGREPCAGLRSASKDQREPPAACPWRASCGKFRLARAAVSADVLVTSHANLLLGRLHAPVDDGYGVTDRLTVEELVLRCYPIVVVDEVDEFQRTALGHAGRGLVLDHGGRTDTPLRRFDTEFGAAFGAFHEEVDASVRDDYQMLRYLSEKYVSHLTYERLSQPGVERARRPGPTRYWTVPQRSDNWLAGKLLKIESVDVGEADLDLFRSIFLDEGEERTGEPAFFQRLRVIMRSVVAAGPTGISVASARTALDDVLEDLTAPERVKVVNRMLRRAFLQQIRRHLHGLMANSAQMLDAGVESAQEITEALGGFNRWRVTPTGPLGRLLFAFRESRDLSGREYARLATAAFGGDPHSYLVGLGDTTALALAGVRRIVLGLSATSYFPRAPQHHVFVEPRWWVSDLGKGAVTVRAAPIELGPGKNARISGLDGAAWEDAVRLVGSQLWSRHLEQELKRLTRDDPDRVSVLLATTSYRAAELLAEGLSSAGLGRKKICLAVPPRAGRGGEASAGLGDGKWQPLPADQLELFPETGAELLIAPLARVQRGVNILGSDDKSALGSVWLIVRPIPLIDEPAELVAHLQARAIREYRGPSSDPLHLLEQRRRVAGTYFEDIVKCPPYFQAQPAEVKLSVVAEMLVGAIQLIGRARRGGTSAELRLVDGAFLDDRAGADFATLLKRLREAWRRSGEWDRMCLYYGSTLQAFFDYADGVGREGQP